MDFLRLGQRFWFGQIFLVGFQGNLRSFEADQNMASLGLFEVVLMRIVVSAKIQIGELRITGNFLGECVGENRVGLDRDHLFRFRSLVQHALARLFCHDFEIAVLFGELPLVGGRGSGASVLRHRGEQQLELSSSDLPFADSEDHRVRC